MTKGEPDGPGCRHHTEVGGCAALRILEGRIRALEDQAHAAFHGKLKSPPRKRTVHKPVVTSHPTVNRKSKNPACPGCSAQLDPAQIAVMSSAICTACDTHFHIS